MVDESDTSKALIEYLGDCELIESGDGKVKLNKRSQIDIINEIMLGKTDAQICRKFKLEPLALIKLRLANPKFKEVTEYAREYGMDWLADSLIDGRGVPPEFSGDPRLLKVYSENVRWLLSKRAKSKYGDSVDVNVTGEISLVSALNKAQERARVIETEVVDSEEVDESE